MKAINKIIILGMVTTLFSSCDLTLLPENAVTPENYFQNKSDLELWTNQFYTLLDEPDASAGTNADDMIDKGMGQVIEGTRSALAKPDGHGANSATSIIFCNIPPIVMMKPPAANITVWHSSSELISIS